MKVNIKELAGNVPYYSAVFIRSNGLCFETNFREIEIGKGEHLLVNRGKYDIIIVNDKGETFKDARNFSKAFILSQKLLGFKQDGYLRKKAEEKVKMFKYINFDLNKLIPANAFREFESLDGRELNPECMEFHNYVPVIVSYIGAGYLKSNMFYRVDDVLVVDTDVISSVPLRNIVGSRKQFSEMINRNRTKVLNKIPMSKDKILSSIVKDVESVEDFAVEDLNPGLTTSVLFNKIKGKIVSVLTLDVDDTGSLMITKEVNNFNDYKEYDNYEDIPISQELEIVLKANQIAYTSYENGVEELTLVGTEGNITYGVGKQETLGILEEIRNRHRELRG